MSIGGGGASTGVHFSNLTSYCLDREWVWPWGMLTLQNLSNHLHIHTTPLPGPQLQPTFILIIFRPLLWLL